MFYLLSSFAARQDSLLCKALY